MLFALLETATLRMIKFAFLLPFLLLFLLKLFLGEPDGPMAFLNYLPLLSMSNSYNAHSFIPRDLLQRFFLHFFFQDIVPPVGITFMK